MLTKPERMQPLRVAERREAAGARSLGRTRGRGRACEDTDGRGGAGVAASVRGKMLISYKANKENQTGPGEEESAG